MSDELKNGCTPSDCASCGLDCGSNSSTESHNTITLTLDDDTEIECAILTVFPVDAQEYIALLPLDENGQNQTNGNEYVLKDRKAYAEEMNELLEIEIEFQIHTVTLEDIERCDDGKFDALTPEDLEILQFMIAM